MSAPRSSVWHTLSARREPPGGRATNDPRTSRARLALCAIALGLAPVLLALGDLIMVSTGDKAAQEVADIAGARGRFLAGNLLFVLGAAALVPGALALARLVRARGAAWATTGACMVAIGGGSLAVAVWSYTIVGYVGTEPGASRVGLVSLIDHANNSILVGAAWILGIGALFGFVVTAIGLIRARTVPLWEPILLIVAAVLTFVSGQGTLAAVLTLPMVVALIALAYEALTADSRAPAATAPGVIDLSDPAAADAGMPAQREGEAAPSARPTA
jgi:hypothetical protein